MNHNWHELSNQIKIKLELPYLNHQLLELLEKTDCYSGGMQMKTIEYGILTSFITLFHENPRPLG